MHAPQRARWEIFFIQRYPLDFACFPIAALKDHIKIDCCSEPRVQDMMVHQEDFHGWVARKAWHVDRLPCSSVRT
jgi:hypothetical protein